MAQINPRGPEFSPAASEDVLSGGQRLRRAFLEAGTHSADRGTVIVPQNHPDPPAFLIQRGLAFCSTTLPDGRRAITDLFLPGDIVGTESAVMGRSTQEVIAASGVYYRTLNGSTIREFMREPAVALRVLALAGEARRRAERHMIALTRLDARERVCALLLGVYERLRRREFITRPTFNLSLTQEEIGDHLGLTMVHVSRTLRRLREEKLVILDRHVVIILNLDELRRAASGVTPMPAGDERNGIDKAVVRSSLSEA